MPEMTEEPSFAQFTGERVIPGRVESGLWNEHVSRYHFAATFSHHRRVLDVGCGAGYGTALLARDARIAIGFDIASDAVDYARAHHGGEAYFLRASADSFPVKSNSIQLITAFEVIEHIAAWPDLIKEAARVLDNEGLFLVSTPNQTYYAETRQETGPNPFHVHEFELEEFRNALCERFSFVSVLGQNRQEAFVFSGQHTASHLQGVSTGSAGPQNAHFFLAVCSKRPADIHSFVFIPEKANLLWERERHIKALKEELTYVRQQQRDLLDRHEELHRELERQNDWGRKLDAELNETRETLTNWAKRAVAEVEQKGEELKKAYELLKEAEDRVTERTDWAYRLGGELNQARELLKQSEGQVNERTEWALNVNDELAQTRELLKQAEDRVRESTESATKLQGIIDQSSPAIKTLSQKLEIRNLSLERLQVQFSVAAQTVSQLLAEREQVRQSRWLKLGRLCGLGPKLDEDPL